MDLSSLSRWIYCLAYPGGLVQFIQVDMTGLVVHIVQVDLSSLSRWTCLVYPGGLDWTSYLGCSDGLVQLVQVDLSSLSRWIYCLAYTGGLVQLSRWT